MKYLSLVRAYAQRQDDGGLEAYRAAWQEGFAHYERYWGGDLRQLVEVDAAELERREIMLRQSIDEWEVMLNHHGVDISSVTVVFMVGSGVSNGHVYISPDAIVVWYALEAYADEASVKTFGLHELLHGAHAVSCPELALSVESSQLRPAIEMFMVEGLATAMSLQLSDLTEREALWANYLDEATYADWLRAYSQRELASAVLHRDIDPFFTGGSVIDPKRYRGGYLLGLEWARQFCNGRTLLEVLQANVDVIQDSAREFLTNCAK